MCTAIRLAKFNVLAAVIPDDGPKVFYGMPSTFAGGLCLVIFLIGIEQGWDSVVRWTPIAAIALAALMVSNMPLPKLVVRKSLAFNIFQGLNVAMGAFCGITRLWPEFIFISVTIYAVFGFTWGQIHRRELMPKTTDLDPYPS
jgi:CDP-diacylglycerol--serine O-phosphatidyltransferase